MKRKCKPIRIEINAVQNWSRKKNLKMEKNKI